MLGVLYILFVYSIQRKATGNKTHVCIFWMACFVILFILIHLIHLNFEVHIMTGHFTLTLIFPPLLLYLFVYCHSYTYLFLSPVLFWLCKVEVTKISYVQYVVCNTNMIWCNFYSITNLAMFLHHKMFALFIYLFIYLFIFLNHFL